MKIITPPIYLIKARSRLEKYGEEVCGRITESNAFEIGSKIENYFPHFKKNVQIDAGDFDRFVGALGFVFSKCVEMVSDWKLEWLNLSEHDLTDGVYCLVNNNRSQLVYPIGLIRSDFLKNTHKSESFFRAVAAGDIPSGTQNDFKEYIL